MDIETKLFEFIGRQFEIGDDPDYTMNVNLFDYGYLDSLGATVLIVHIEEEFGVEITPGDIMKYSMNTVNEIAGVVREKLHK